MSAWGGGKPTPCDLESIRSIRAIGRLAATSEELCIVEMLPAPDHLPVSDLAHESGDRLVSALMLRLPCDESPAAMAARVAAHFVSP
jgi:hypothetical protein